MSLNYLKVSEYVTIMIMTDNSGWPDNIGTYNCSGWHLQIVQCIIILSNWV